jgi:hypothetical protein
MSIRDDNRQTVIVLALLVLLTVLLSSCTTDRERATADAAATIWEGADAIEKGVPGAMVAPAIKQNAAAIIKAQGVAYPPAGVTP